MKTITFTPEHPIVFICDYDSSEVEIPEYDAGSIASVSETCVSIRTIADVDGDVTITLSNTTPEPILEAYKEVFSGQIEIFGSEVAVVNSANERLLAIAVVGPMIQVRVFVDNEKYPERLWVEVEDGTEDLPTYASPSYPST